VTPDPNDDSFIETLAGRGTGTSDDAREAALLRARILAEPAEAVSPPAAHDPAREDALIARARAAGLLPDRRRPPVTAQSALIARRTGLAAAALVVLGLGLALTWHGREPEEAVRGGAAGIVHIEAADAHALQRELLSELTAAGVSATPYERLGAAGLDADLPTPVTAAARAVLERHRIPVPADGVLVIEIREPSHP